MPRTLAEASLVLTRPVMVILEYEGALGQLRLVQGERPELDASAEFDLALCGEIGLRVLGVEPEEAHRLAQTIDWAATLTVPVPQGTTELREMPLRGGSGLLIAAATERTIVWTEAGQLVALTGTLSEGDLVAIADSLR